MHELTYLQVSWQRRREMMREAERERLAAEARRARKEQADRQTSDPGWDPRRPRGGHRLDRKPRA